MRGPGFYFRGGGGWHPELHLLHPLYTVKTFMPEEVSLLKGDSFSGGGCFVFATNSKQTLSQETRYLQLQCGRIN